MGVRPEKELRQPTDAAVAAAAGENDDRSFPAGEARVGEGSAARSDDMLQGDTEIAGEGVAVAKAAMASDGERRRVSGFGWRGGGEWQRRSALNRITFCSADWVPSSWAGPKMFTVRPNGLD